MKDRITVDGVEYERVEPQPTEIIFLLDMTGSMQPKATQTLDGLKEYVSSIAGHQITRESSVFSLYVFNSTIGVQNRIKKQRLDAIDLSEFDLSWYRPMDSTPLYDAVGEIIQASTDNRSHLMIIQTDGQENMSSKYNRSSLSELIKQKKEAGWTFVFLGTDIDAWAEAGGIGLTKGTTMSYPVAATLPVYHTLAMNTTAYVAAGSTPTDNFFSGTASVIADDDSEDDQTGV